MAYLLESRKVNGINIPLYFKFATIIAKGNVTADKLLTYENWTAIFDELNPLLATDLSSSSKKTKAFEIDSGRLIVKPRWAKLNDTDDVGTQIVKILSLSSSSLGKYFLKIDIRMNSYLERIAAELEQKSQAVKVDVRNHSKADSHESHNSSKHKKFSHRKISDMLPTIKKVFPVSPALFDDSATVKVLEELNDDDLNEVEEYIPLPKTSPTVNAASTPTDTLPTYTPEKCIAPEMNAFHSEYSPVSLTADKSLDESATYEPTAVTSPTATYHPEKKLSEIEINKLKYEYSPTCTSLQQPIEDEIVYKPTTRKTKFSDNEKTKKVLSKELFGSSDENSGDDLDKVSSSSPKSKRRMDSPLRREKKFSKERSKSKKQKFDALQSGQKSITEDGDISIRNVMGETVDAVLATYSEHGEYLTGLYRHHVQHIKRSYKPHDIPDMLALDIVSPDQFTAMIEYLEMKLVDTQEEPHYSDIIFDLLIPEWALAIFCEKLHCSRDQGLQRLRLQAQVLSNSSL